MATMQKRASSARAGHDPAKALLARRIHLRQLRAARDIWSDGQNIFEGEALATLRRDTLNRIIRLKADLRNPNMFRLTRNLKASVSYLAQTPDETLPDWLVRRLTTSAGQSRQDPGSADTALTTRRLLRRQFPDVWRGLPDILRFSSREMSHVAERRAKNSWVVKETTTVEIDAGCSVAVARLLPAVPGPKGRFLVAIGGFGAVEIPAGAVRRARPGEAAQDRDDDLD